MWRSNPNKFRAWFVAIAVFAVLACAMDTLWTRVVIDGSAASDAGRLNHLIHEHGSEIPIFGASQARYDYVPEILGDNVFNYGMAGISPDVVAALLEIECKKHKQTPIVVDPGHSHVQQRLGNLSKFPPYAWQPEIREMLVRLKSMEWRYLVPGLRYFGYYDSYLSDYLAERMSKTKKTVRGYTVASNRQPFDHRVLDKNIKQRLEAGYGFSSYSDPQHLLFDVMKNTPERTFIIVFSPVHSSCFVNFQNREDFAQYLGTLRSLTNVVVLDWSHMELADDCFDDTVHLNERGAREFSQRLANRIRTVCSAAIPDKPNFAGAASK
jgi:hypothetical protein